MADFSYDNRRQTEAHSRRNADDDAVDHQKFRRSGDDTAGGADGGEDLTDDNRSNAADAIGKTAGEQSADDALQKGNGGRRRPERHDGLCRHCLVTVDSGSASLFICLVVEVADEEIYMGEDAEVVAEEKRRSKRDVSSGKIPCLEQRSTSMLGFLS